MAKLRRSKRDSPERCGHSALLGLVVQTFPSLGDSFTSANAVACINHARLMSGEPRLSKQDVAVVVACLNAVYDDASSIRHSLHEIARGCFVGAGYFTEDADAFYEEICQDAAQAFYAGRSMINSD